MAGKSSVSVIARHELFAADRRPPSFARRTCATSNYGGDDHSLVLPLLHLFACSHNPASYFVAQHEREFMPSRHAIKSKADVRMTHTATGDLYDHFVRTRFQSGKFSEVQGDANLR
jgi:hypothetical protein